MDGPVSHLHKLFCKIRSFSSGGSFRDHWGPERGSDSPKVTRQARTRDGLQARDLSTKGWKNKAIQRRGRHLSTGILQGWEALFESPFPPSLPPQRAALPGTLLTTGLQCEQEPPGAGTEPETPGKRRSHRGLVSLAPPAGVPADRSQGGSQRGEASSLRSGRRRRARTGREGGGGGSCACAAGSRRLRGGGRAGRVLSAPPRKSRVFRAALRGGGGDGRKGAADSSGAPGRTPGGEGRDGVWRLHLQPLPPPPPPPLLPPLPGEAPSIRLQPGDSEPGRGLGPAAASSSSSSASSAASSRSTNPRPSPPPAPSSAAARRQPTARPLVGPRRRRHGARQASSRPGPRRQRRVWGCGLRRPSDATMPVSPVSSRSRPTLGQ